MNPQLVAYIKQAAAQRGIDPEIALRVARSEGGLDDPFRHGAGPAPKSQSAQYGGTENSYGPFQLYVSGTGAGLGDRAVAAGIDPAKDWQKGIDFALDEVTRKGWGQWYGAKGQGITGYMGVGGKRSPALYGTDAQNAAPPPQPQLTSKGGPGGGTFTGEAPTEQNMSGPTPEHAYTPPLLAKKEPEKKSWQDMLASSMEGFGKGMGGMSQQSAPAPNFTPVASPSIAQQAAPIIDPQAADNQRQMMAAALMRLNSGKLYG